MRYAIAKSEGTIPNPKNFGEVLKTLVSDFKEIMALCSYKPLHSPYLNEEDRTDAKNALESLKDSGSIGLEDFERELKNQNAIKFLDEWMSEPDDLGERFWNSFREELNQNPFHID